LIPKETIMSTLKHPFSIAFILCIALLPGIALAGDAGAIGALFDPLYELFAGLIQGGLGRLFVLSGFFIAFLIFMFKQQWLVCGICLIASVLLIKSPQLVSGLFTALI
jgi:hypothetical protein